MSHLVVPDVYPCPFCDYLSGARPYTILHREADAAILVTREQRGASHLLVVTERHAPTILELRTAESHAVIELVRMAARLIDQAEQRPGISVWQNNGAAAHQTIPHVHFHIAGTLPEGGTDWEEVHELSIEETDAMAERLRAYF
ncbi:HIT domain-containing protein [Jiangella aurantiaca]|uniref:HIT domain-containing protein n=1 Tax=Jiangella aurantiaca TaxID=2530373 RepID=A0A4R5A4E0_9ACTN|nr:HIT domain-containing protein [Jiangella aurantiaca]